MKSLDLHKGGLKGASGIYAAYFLRAAFALLFVAMASSCQTLPTTVKLEHREIQSLKELQEYMGYALRGRDFDVETLLMLTEEYFKEADEVLKEMEKEPAPGTLPPGIDHSSLIKGFQALIKKYPYKPGMAPVHYTLGSLLQEGGQLNDAMTVFEDFIERYKEHAYFAEASFRLGEIYFDTDQFGEARDAYERVLEGPDPVFREKVIYKLGWTHYKLDEFKRAFSYFARLMEDIPEGNLKKRAFKNVVMCLSHMQFDDIEGAGGVVEGFREKDYAPGVVLELGRVFYEQTRFEEAIRTYTLFRAAFDQDPSLPFVYGETAGAYERLKKYELALGIREEAVEKFNPASRWYAMAYPEGNPEVDSLVAESLLAVATYYNKRGEDSRDADGALKKATRAYKSYLSHFPEFGDGRRVKLLLAEALFEAGEYLEASINYESVMHLYSQTGEGEDAAFAALLCYELIAARGAEVDTESTAASIKRITESFEAAFPKSKRLNMLRRKAADMYVRMGYYEEARGMLATLVKADNAAAAYKKTGDIFMAEKDLRGAIHAYTEALEIAEDKELRTKLAQLHYMVAVDSVKEGRQDEAADHYLKVFKNLKNSELSENALLNVGRIYIEAGDMERLGTVLKVLRTDYPGSKGLLGLSVEAGKMLERKGLFKASARMFEEASRLAGGAEGEDASLRLKLKAATMLQKAGEYGKLEAVLGKLYEDGVINEKRRTEVLYMLGVARLKNGKTDEGIKTLELISDETSGSYYVSKARLMLADEKVKEFTSLKITQPFEQSLMKKEALLTELIEDLSYVLQSGMARLLPEAFYQMGLVFENFKDSLIESERPAGLSTEELDEYVFLVEEKAYPFEEKAVKAYENSLRASIELWEPGGAGGAGIIASRTVKRLARLRPALYKRELATGKAIIFVEPEPILKPVI